MRLTNKNARVDKAGRHNDRNFDLTSAIHINKEKVSGNKYITYLGGDYNTSFNELELDFYRQNFKDYIDKRNQRNIEGKHKERVISMENYYKMKNTKPEDKIIQIGDIDNHIDADLLWECALEYMDKFNDLYGDHCKIVDMALHVDEATPHVHVRRVWMAENEDGDLYISQNKALEQMGFERPRLDEEKGRFNNAKVTFTRKDKELFLDICKDKGIEVEPPRALGKQKSLSIQEYKESKERIKTVYDEEIQQLKKQAKEEQEKVNPLIDKYLEMIQNSPIFNYDDEIEEAKKKGYEAKYKLLMEFFSNEMSYVEDITSGDISLTEYAQYKKLNEEYRDIVSFLKKKGYDKEYAEYKENKTKQKEQAK